MKNKIKYVGILCIIAVITISIAIFILSIYKKSNSKIVNINSNIEKQNLQSGDTFDLELPNQIIGILEIPKIKLVGQIHEGTEMQVIKKYIGHFESTNIWSGNIGLCAHNKGYDFNYFENLSKLKIEDEIIYKTQYGTKKFKVSKIKTISETDWSELGVSNTNEMTLLTCISGQPDKRLCVKAKEI